jgi:polysaccharide export outer membrane protein
MGAVFDVNSIRSGTAKDPEIVSNDLVIVGYSQAKSIWRDILSSVPLLNVFRPY